MKRGIIINLILLTSLITFLKVSFSLVYAIMVDETVSFELTATANYMLLLGITFYILVNLMIETKCSINEFFDGLKEIKETQRYVLRVMCLVGFVFICIGTLFDSALVLGAILCLIPSTSGILNEFVKLRRKQKQKTMEMIKNG